MLLVGSACGESLQRDDEPVFTTTGASSTSDTGDAIAVSGSSSSDGADGESTSGDAAGSWTGPAGSSSTGPTEGCGNGVPETDELCLDQVEETWPMGPDARGMAIGDFDLSGTPDIATLDTVTAALNVRFNEGGRVLSELESWPVTEGAFAVQSGDFDYDGDTDVVVFGKNLTIFVNHAGVLMPSEVPSAGLFVSGLNHGVVGEFNVVLGLDVVHTGDNLVHFQRGTVGEDGWTFAEQIQLPIATEGASGIATAVFAWDDDEMADVVVLNRNLEFAQVLRAGGAGQFVHVTNVQVCPQNAGAYRVAIADVDGDGWEDLVTTCDIGVWSLVRGTGPAEYAAPELQILDTAYHPQIVDLDLDGDLDVGITQSGLGRVELFLNDGAGNLVYEQTLDASGDTWAFDVVDLDDDGALDVVGAQATNAGGLVSVFWSQP